MDVDLIKKTIFGKYKVLKVLGKGAFGMIFKGINILTKEFVAIKAEDWKVKGEFLESEAYILYYLRNFGIPEIKSFGSYKKYKILVQNLLGDNLEYLFLNDEEQKLNFKDICMIAIQLIDRLEFIHSKYVIHRDLKPENLLIDLETGTIIYLIDFGMAKKYRSGKTKKHIKFQLLKKFTGTLRYSSVNATRGGELSRRDDLESAGYVLIYLSQRRYLPWMGITAKTKRDKFINNYKMKKNMKEEILCRNLPNQFCDYMKYVKKLQFEEDPDYNYLRWLFNNLLISLQCQNDLKFNWNLGVKSKVRNTSNSKNQRNDLLLKRKKSPYTGIMRNIKNSKEKEKKMQNIEQKKVEDILEEKQSEKSKDISKDTSEKNNKMDIGEIPIKKNDDNLNINKTSENIDTEEKKNNISDLATKIAQFNIDLNIEDLDDAKSDDVIEKNTNNKHKKLNIEEFKNKNYKNINYRSIYKDMKEQKGKNFFTEGNNSLKAKDKLNYISEFMNKNNNITIISTKNLDKENKIKKIKEQKQLKLNYLYFNKLPKKKFLLKNIINKIPINTNAERINNISTSYYKTLDSKKTKYKRIAIPKSINQKIKKNTNNLENLRIRRNSNLKQLTPNRIKYVLTYNNVDFLKEKLRAKKRRPINYNQMNIDNSDGEIKMNFNQNKNKTIKNYNYNKFFYNSNSMKEFNTLRMRDISPFQNTINQNTEFLSVIKVRKLNNRINENNYINKEELYNSEQLFNTKQKMNRIFRNQIRRDNVLKSGSIPNQKEKFNDNSRNMFSDSNINKYNNLSIDIPDSNRRNLLIYKRQEKHVLDIKKIPKVNTSVSNINVKQNFIFPINNCLTNCNSYKKKPINNDTFFTYGTNNN